METTWDYVGLTRYVLSSPAYSFYYFSEVVDLDFLNRHHVDYNPQTKEGQTYSPISEVLADAIAHDIWISPNYSGVPDGFRSWLPWGFISGNPGGREVQTNRFDGFRPAVPLPYFFEDGCLTVSREILTRHGAYTDSGFLPADINNRFLCQTLEDGCFVVEVTNICHIDPSDCAFALAEPLPYQYENNTLKILANREDCGFLRAVSIESQRGKTVENYEGYRLVYLPSKKFGMRFGAYRLVPHSNRAIAIKRTLAELKQFIDRRVGNLPLEPGAAVLGGRQPGPKPYDAVLGHQNKPASMPVIPEIIPTHPTVSHTESYTDINEGLWDVDDFEIE